MSEPKRFTLAQLVAIKAEHDWMIAQPGLEAGSIVEVPKGAPEAPTYRWTDILAQLIEHERQQGLQKQAPQPHDTRQPDPQS